MVERKRFSGDDTRGSTLLALARNLLAELRQQMSLNKLMIGKRTFNFEGGVTITVSSVFGQDEVQIYAPDAIAQETREEALIRLGNDPEFLAREATDNDIITCSDMLTLTLTIYDNVDINPDPTPGSGTNDVIFVSSAVKLTIITTTYPPAYVPPTPPPQIFIGGTDGGNGDPIIWDDVNGLQRLGLRNGFGQNEKRGYVYGFSADGKLPFGCVAVTRTYTIANPFGGPSSSKQQDDNLAAVWRNGTSDADTASWTLGETSAALKMDSNGTVHGNLGRSQVSPPTTTSFNWDGRGNHTMTPTGTAIAYPTGTITSSNGRLKVQGNKYQLDGGPWLNWGNQYSSGSAALHIPYYPPPPPDQTPTVTTSVLVFSG